MELTIYICFFMSSFVTVLTQTTNKTITNSTLVPDDFYCSKSWNSCYYYNPNKIFTYAASQNFCKEQNSLLAIIDTDSKNKEMLEFITEQGGNDNYGKWIGGNDDNLDGEWTWVTSSGLEMPFTYSNWGKNQPDNKTGNDKKLLWTVYPDGFSEWYDREPDKSENFICEFQGSNPCEKKECGNGECRSQGEDTWCKCDNDPNAWSRPTYCDACYGKDCGNGYCQSKKEYSWCVCYNDKEDSQKDYCEPSNPCDSNPCCPSTGEYCYRPCYQTKNGPGYECGDNIISGETTLISGITVFTICLAFLCIII